MVERQAAGAHVLEYGCAVGDWSLQLAPSVARVDGIDISDVAIRKARESATSLGLDNAFFHAMDAQATSFEDDTFDLVFGSGIIHHLDTRRCLEEIRRILKPGGLAIFKEPLGQNTIINVYRALTPFARTVDEHPLLPADLQIARSLFKEVDWESTAFSPSHRCRLACTRSAAPSTVSPPSWIRSPPKCLASGGSFGTH